MVDLVQKLCRSLADLALPHSASPFGHVSVSIGVAVMIPMQDKSTAYLLKKADEALYQAKALGRNQVVLADEHAT